MAHLRQSPAASGPGHQFWVRGTACKVVGVSPLQHFTCSSLPCIRWGWPAQLQRCKAFHAASAEVLKFITVFQYEIGPPSQSSCLVLSFRLSCPPTSAAASFQPCASLTALTASFCIVRHDVCRNRSFSIAHHHAVARLFSLASRCGGTRHSVRPPLQVTRHLSLSHACDQQLQRCVWRATSQ